MVINNSSLLGVFSWVASCCSFLPIYIYIYRIYHLSTNTSLFQGIFLQQKQHIVQVRKTATWIYTFWYFNWFAAPSAFQKHQLLFFVPKCVVVWWSGIFCSIFFRLVTLWPKNKILNVAKGGSSDPPHKKGENEVMNFDPSAINGRKVNVHGLLHFKLSHKFPVIELRSSYV